MNAKQYTRNLEKWANGIAPFPVWEYRVWFRIAVEAIWWCGAQLVLLWLAYNVMHNIVIPRSTIIWLTASLFTFVLSRFAGGHIGISIGRSIGVILMWIGVYAAI